MSPSENEYYHGCFGFGRYEDAHDDHNDLFQTVHGNKRKEGRTERTERVSYSKRGPRVNTKANRIYVGLATQQNGSNDRAFTTKPSKAEKTQNLNNKKHQKQDRKVKIKFEKQESIKSTMRNLP